MNVLVLGGDGMLGHRVVLQHLGRHNTAFTIRGDVPLSLLPAEICFPRVDVCDLARVMDVFGRFRPDVVVNCAGLVKQRPSGQAVVAASAVNSIAPHQLADLCRVADARFIQISTDCVFSGRQGSYTEQDKPDPVDVYGMTKLLGEISTPGCLTLRTSIVGRELKGKQGLLEWFLAQTQAVRGFRNAVFSGLTTVELARIIETLATEHPEATGLYHVSANPINKYDLLRLFATHYDHTIPILADDSMVIDRSLDSSLFRKTFSYRPPEWEDMVRQASAEEKKAWR